MSFRKYINLSKSKQNEIASMFTDIEKLYDYEEPDEYKKISISVFDHWLERGETEGEVDNVSLERQNEQDQKLSTFCLALVENNESYIIKLRGKRKDKVTYRAFTSVEATKICVKAQPYNIGERWRFVLALPQLEAVYFESSDFTHHLYYKNIEKISELTNLVKNKGLYVLQK